MSIRYDYILGALRLVDQTGDTPAPAPAVAVIPVEQRVTYTSGMTVISLSAPPLPSSLELYVMGLNVDSPSSWSVSDSSLLLLSPFREQLTTGDVLTLRYLTTP